MVRGDHCFLGVRVRVWFALLQALKKPHQRLGDRPSDPRQARRFERRQSLLLGFEIGVEVLVRRLEALVPQPHCNHRQVNARLQQVHGRGVTDRMWRDADLEQRRIGLCRSRHGPFETLSDARPSHLFAAGIGQQRRFGRVLRLFQPPLQ